MAGEGAVMRVGELERVGVGQKCARRQRSASGWLWARWWVGVGSGMKGVVAGRGRPKVLSDLAVTVIVVELCDWLTRFGFGDLAVSMAACGRRTVVLDAAETGGSG